MHFKKLTLDTQTCPFILPQLIDYFLTNYQQSHVYITLEKSAFCKSSG